MATVTANFQHRVRLQDLKAKEAEGTGSAKKAESAGRRAVRENSIRSGDQLASKAFVVSLSDAARDIDGKTTKRPAGSKDNAPRKAGTAAGGPKSASRTGGPQGASPGHESRELYALSAELEELGGGIDAVRAIIRRAAKKADTPERNHLEQDVEGLRAGEMDGRTVLDRHYSASFRQTKTFISSLRVIRSRLKERAADVTGTTPAGETPESRTPDARRAAAAKAYAEAPGAGASNVVARSVQSLEGYQRAYGRVINSDGDAFEDLSRLGGKLEDLAETRSAYMSAKRTERSEAVRAKPSAVHSPLAAGLIREFAAG
jgi:hypothetical protein